MFVALRSSARRLRHHNVQYRSTSGAASGLVHRLQIIDIRRAIAILGQTLIGLYVRRFSARRLRRHNGLYRSTLSAANGLVQRLQTIGIRRLIATIGQTRQVCVHAVPVRDGCVATKYFIIPQSVPQVYLFTVTAQLSICRTIAIIGQTLIRLCARRSSARRLRRHRGL